MLLWVKVLEVSVSNWAEPFSGASGDLEARIDFNSREIHERMKPQMLEQIRDRVRIQGTISDIKGM